MKARVTVTLKSGILDPQGKAIEGALKTLGVAGVASVGKPVASSGGPAPSRARAWPWRSRLPVRAFSSTISKHDGNLRGLSRGCFRRMR